MSGGPLPGGIMAEYEARRCTVCGGRYPSFGFGPPISPGGEIWACVEHRGEVERRLRGPDRRPADPDQPKLFLSRG